MELLNFLISNWLVLLLMIVSATVVGNVIYVFLKRPTSEQLSKVKEWLLYATAKAEKELGSGTGQIKLRYVYDMFIIRFPYLSKTVPFESFSLLVDEVLEKFRNILNSNESLQSYINQ